MPNLLKVTLRIGVVLLSPWISSCATYGFAARGPAPDYSQLPIDRSLPQTSIQWSYLWGMFNNLWSPLQCVSQDIHGNCTKSIDPCGGNGVGLVNADLTWYSVPVTILTLGTVIPERMTAYCSTNVVPKTGP